MTEKDLKELVVKSIGVQTDNTDLVYRVFTKKIANKLNPGGAIKIENVGTFNLAEKDTAIDSTGTLQAGKLIFLPAGENISETEIDKYFASIPIAAQKESTEFNPDSIFDIGVARPLISSTESSEENASLKVIDDKVDELLNNSETIEDFKVWSETKIADASETPADIEDKSEPEVEAPAEEPAAEMPESDDPFVLPDFKSIDDDFTDNAADEKIQIVSEDDIIIPGVEKVKDIEEESDEEIISDENELTETSEDVEEPVDEEENLEDLFKDFESENDTSFETSLPEDITDEFETPGMETLPEIEPEEDKVEESIDNADDVEKLDDEDEFEPEGKTEGEPEGEPEDKPERKPEVESLDIETVKVDEDTNLDEALDETVIEESDTFLDEDDKEFTEAEDKADDDSVNEFVGETTEESDELKEDDLNLADGEFEIDNPDFDKEGIESISASVEDTFDDFEKKIEEDEAETEEDEIAELPSDDEIIEVDKKDEFINDELEENDEDQLNDLPEEGEKILEPAGEESEYSKLRGGESKSALGKGFWISVMVFVVVVVVGAYLYLFVYDSSSKSEKPPPVVESQSDLPEETTPPPPPPAKEEKQEQKSIEDIKKELEAKRDIVKIQGTGDTGFYRDGSDEVRLGNGIFNKNGLYSVQVSSFKTQSVAENDAKELQDRGYDAFIVKAFVQKFNADYYRVRIGYFNSKKEAEDFQKEFKR
ncbi:MAG: hypothetical protein HND52_02275 [Ignavibacteriae bacterium]|nr:hypothetical protein [Ignavibacteriota bacterium]NOG96776.1 hypothetical protein [Ignavibacteriota bacterium]